MATLPKDTKLERVKQLLESNLSQQREVKQMNAEQTVPYESLFQVNKTKVKKVNIEH
jgi:hypothetical protein